jgi:hypothetical protein
VKKNRFGKVKKSDEVGLNRMMNRHMEEACEWMLRCVGLGGGDEVV